MTPLPHYLLPDTARVGSDGHLIVGGCDVLELADIYGTPLFVYDEAHLRARCREAVEAFGEDVFYAAKAFLCRAMARLVHEEGLGMDVASGGELYVALSAGFPPDRLVFHGNNKSLAELRAALEAGVGRIVVDSFDELDRLESLHSEGYPAPRVLLRLTPGVEAHTHEFVRTGGDDTKFGFSIRLGLAERAYELASASSAVRLVGYHFHIGSQVFRLESFAEAISVVADFVARRPLEELSVGGGLGVPYVGGEPRLSIRRWAEVVRKAVADAGLQVRILAEPGRSLVAAAAITVYTAGTVKTLPGIRTYVAVDGGMSDNPRPSLYGSDYETFLPRAVDAPRTLPVRLVGKHCESGDVLVADGRLPSDLRVGDFVATPVTGAYGHSMGSNYNKVPRPAVVFVADGTHRLVIRRETYEDLLATDLG
ncbi:MAG: diaminopimelate decarboxylase [Acidimicrobiia bacterium]|nr:MAG: diaminopimelate decarboxylase [Acidimicrobiia bacterium]